MSQAWVRIDKDERFPDYSMSLSPLSGGIGVDRDFVTRVFKVAREYSEIQRELGRLYEQQEAAASGKEGSDEQA